MISPTSYVSNNTVLPSIKYLHNSSIVQQQNDLQSSGQISTMSSQSVLVYNNRGASINNSQIIGLPQTDIGFLGSS